MYRGNCFEIKPRAKAGRFVTLFECTLIPNRVVFASGGASSVAPSTGGGFVGSLRSPDYSRLAGSLQLPEFGRFVGSL